MQVKKLKELFAQYTAFLQTEAAQTYTHLWETQSNFLAHWDLEERDLAEMFDRALQNDSTQRIWNRQAYEPKRILLLFAELFPDFLIQMFNDLYNEEKSIESRVQRFGFYWEQLLVEYREQNKGTKLNEHYHNDGYEITSYYLTFRYPEQYIPYQMERFQLFLKKVGSQDIPLAHDIERYFKVMRTIRKLIGKEEQLLEAHQSRMQKVEHQVPDSLLLVFDFVWYSTRELPYYF